MKRKIAVSIPEDLADRVEKAVSLGRASSVSAYVSQALEEKTRRDRLADVLDEMDRELGAPTGSDQAWARRVSDRSPRRRRAHRVRPRGCAHAALLRLGRERSTSFVIPAGALARAWRDGRRQARLAALAGSEATTVEALDEAAAKAVGAPCGRSGIADVADASVVLAARVHAAVVVTTDPDDLRRLDPAVELEEL